MDASARMIAAFLAAVMLVASYRSATRQLRIGDPFRPPRLPSGFDVQRWALPRGWAYVLAVAEAAAAICLLVGLRTPGWAGAGALIVTLLYLASLWTLSIETTGYWVALGLHVVMLGGAAWVLRAVDWGPIFGMDAG
jgi:hypothetical protein